MQSTSQTRKKQRQQFGPPPFTSNRSSHGQYRVSVGLNAYQSSQTGLKARQNPGGDNQFFEARGNQKVISNSAAGVPMIYQQQYQTNPDIQGVTAPEEKSYYGQQSSSYATVPMRQQATAHTLTHMTQAREQPPLGKVPPVKLAQYQLSQKSSITKANSGKIEKLGTFMERARLIKEASATSNFFTNNLDSASSHQPRNRSQLQLKAFHDRQIIQIGGENYATGSAYNSGQSSHNIKAAKYSHPGQVGRGFTSVTAATGSNSVQPRHQSTYQLRSGNKNRMQFQQQQQRAASLKRLQINSQTSSSALGSANTRGEYARFGGVDGEDTKQILERYARIHSAAATSKRSTQRNQKAKVIFSSESNDERIKLVVVQSSFTDVIQAMYSNERQSSTGSPPLEKQTEPHQDESAYSAAGQITTQPLEHEAMGTERNANEGNMETMAAGNNEDTNRDDIKRHSTGDMDSQQYMQQKQMEPKQLATHDSSDAVLKAVAAEKKDQQSSTEMRRDSIQTEPNHKEIKMMDTITFVDGFQPVNWIFTDLLGKIQSKEISQITVNEVIKAFLINLNHNKKADFSNDDLMQFMDKEQINQKICFAIKGTKRELLGINDLLDLRKKFPRGIDALQLFKIPTRSFIPFYFHHILAFDQMGRPLRSTLIRLPIHEVQKQMERIQLNETMNLLKEKTSLIQQRIQQVSNDVVSRLTEVSPVVLLNIVIVYLLEDSSLDPWFIGTEKCEVLTQKVTAKRKAGKRSTYNKNAFASAQDQPVKSYPHPLQDNFDNSSQPEESQRSMLTPDSPTKIQIIDTQIQQHSSTKNNSNQNNGAQMQQQQAAAGAAVSQQHSQRIANRGGRTSSTTTVFQKLDSRSHLTTQKNPMNDETEDHYMMMLNGGDENIQALLINREQRDQDVPISATRDIESGRNRQEHEFSGVIPSQKKQGPISFDTGMNNRPYTTVLANKEWPAYSTQSAMAGQLSESNKPAHGTAYGSGGPDETQPLEDPESSFFNQRRQTQPENTNQRSQSLIESELKHGQTDGVNDMMALAAEHGDSELLQQLQDIKSSHKIISKSAIIEQNDQEEANSNEQRKQQSLQNILQNRTFMDNLRDGPLRESAEMVDEDGVFCHEENVGDYELMGKAGGKQRGQSANIYASRKNPQRPKLEELDPALIGKSTTDLHRHVSGLGTKASYLQRRQHTEQDVYMLESNELLTANELFSGLAKIGIEYGRSASHQANVRIQNNLPRKSSNETSKKSKFGKSGRDGISRGASSKQVASGGTASRIRNFLQRQEQLKATSDQSKAQKMLLKPQGRRLLDLFPYFLEKSASRHHSRFLFGDAEQMNVFRDYKNAMLSVENQVKNLGDCMLPQNVLNNDVKMFQLARENGAGGKIFNMKMSDQEEMNFFEQVIDEPPSHREVQQFEEQLPQIEDGVAMDAPNVRNYQNLDLESLSKDNSFRPGRIEDQQDYDTQMYQAQREQNETSSDQRTGQEAASSQGGKTMKARDFLAETLMESRKMFRQTSKQHSMFNNMDQQALTMIEAQKQLDGIAVVEPEQVINDFKNNHLFRPMPGDNDYNLLGQVPKVNQELAAKYVEIRDAMRRRKHLEEAQRKIQNQTAQTTLSSAVNRRSAKARSTLSSQPHQKPQSKSRQSKRNFLKVSGHEFDKTSPTMNTEGGYHMQPQPVSIIPDKAFLMTANPWSDAIPVVAQQDVGGVHQINSILDPVFHQQQQQQNQASDTIVKGNEMTVEPNIRDTSQPASLETIDQVVHSLQKQQSDIHTSGSATGLKCSMGICCDNTNILVSQEMSIQDICYIQQDELDKAKQFLLQNRATEETIIRYSHQFNQTSSENRSPNKEYDLYSQSEIHQDINTSQISVNPMLEPSRKEVAVGHSTDENNEYQINDQSAAKKNSTLSANKVSAAEANIGGSKESAPAQATPVAPPLNAMAFLGTRNNSEQTRYQALTQQIIAESCRSTLPLLQKQRTEALGGDVSPETSQRNQREFVEMLGRQGISAVKRLTNQIFRDYGYVGMFSEEYDQVVAAQVADSSQNSIKNTNNAASAILKPIEDLAEQKRQIFKHERMAAPMGAAAATQPISQNTHTDMLQESQQNMMASMNDMQISVQQPNELGGESPVRFDSQLSQLGIRHVKLDQENWVPSPELVPCCVRCFSIATYVLNYQLANQANADKMQTQN